MNRSEWRDSCFNLEELENKDELYQEARKLGLSLGFDKLVFGITVPTSLNKPLIEVYGESDLPPGWADQYRQGTLQQHDPIVRQTRAVVGGVNWDSPGLKQQNPEYWDTAFRHGLRHGWSQPTRRLNGLDAGVTSFIRSNDPVSDLELDAIEMRMSMLSQTLHTKVMALTLEETENVEKLSIDEISVLRWSADGCDAANIGAMLGVSPRAVDRIRSSAMKKLGVYTTTQATMKAAALGFLQILNDVDEDDEEEEEAA